MVIKHRDTKLLFFGRQTIMPCIFYAARYTRNNCTARGKRASFVFNLFLGRKGEKGKGGMNYTGSIFPREQGLSTEFARNTHFLSRPRNKLSRKMESKKKMEKNHSESKYLTDSAIWLACKTGRNIFENKN